MTPFRLGITGHQRLADETAWTWVRSALQEVIASRPQPIEGVSSLARGADQLLADVVLAAGGTVYAVIPFAGYERTLDGSALSRYRELRQPARSETLAVCGDDQAAYLAAGKRVVDLSDLLVAVWDGKRARGVGGTADIVRYAKSVSKEVVHINPHVRTVRTIPA